MSDVPPVINDDSIFWFRDRGYHAIEVVGTDVIFSRGVWVGENDDAYRCVLGELTFKVWDLRLLREAVQLVDAPDEAWEMLRLHEDPIDVMREVAGGDYYQFAASL